jgi:hypothetical protein
MNKNKQESILFGTVVSGILIASSLLSISSQLVQEVRAQNMINQTTTNATANQIDMDNATTLPSPCCPSNGYIANAGPDQTVSEGTIITLNGSGNNNNNKSSSTIVNTAAANYLWRQMDGPAIILNGNNTAHPTFVAPNYPNDTKYTFALEVYDSQVVNNNNNQTGSAIDTVDIISKDANMEAKSPGSLQEQDDNTGEQSDQDELSDEGTTGEEDDDDASVAEFSDGSDADDSDDSSGDGGEGGDAAE